MALNVGWMTLDTPEPANLAPFWEQLLGWPRGDEDDQSVEFVSPWGRTQAAALALARCEGREEPYAPGYGTRRSGG
jgi:hypothetical protein